MPLALMVAEKPAVARGIASVLAPGCRSQPTQAKYVRLYEFQAHINSELWDIRLTAVCGHLMKWDFGKAYENWYGSPPERLFDAPLEHLPNSGNDKGANCRKILGVLQRYIRGCQLLLIATDSDREGENIGFEIIEACRKKNKRFIAKRMRFSAVTPAEINTSLRNLVPPDQLMSDACVARQHLDLRIGCIFTRFQTMRYRKMFSSLASNLISYGPCQFPTLGFVVERYRERERFIPEDFWRIVAKHRCDENTTVDFNWSRYRVYDEDVCGVFLDLCTEAQTATVANVTGRPRDKWRPVGLTTTEMQKIASRRFRVSPSEALSVAESLYQKGFISYPRTETDMFDKSINLTRLVENLTPHQEWGQFAQSLLPPNGAPSPRNGRNSDEAHPPIHPTKNIAPAGLNTDRERQIYELVCCHFLACCSRNAKGRETTVTIQAAGETFVAKGLTILDRGYLDVYHRFDSWSGKVIPEYEVGQRIEPDFQMQSGETTAPKLLSEADLLSLMAKHEIGTDATMADHIRTIQARHYVELTPQRELVPTTLGIALVNGYDDMSFTISVSRPDLRREMEANMKRICRGQITKDAVVSDGVEKYRQVFNVVQQEVNKLDGAIAEQLGQPTGQPGHIPVEVRPCPGCNQRQQVLRQTGRGVFIVSCPGYPACRSSTWLSDLEACTVTTQACSRCGAKKLKMKFKPNTLPPYIQRGRSEIVACLCDNELSPYLDGGGAGNGGGSGTRRNVTPAPTTTTNATTTTSNRRASTPGRDGRRDSGAKRSGATRPDHNGTTEQRGRSKRSKQRTTGSSRPAIRGGTGASEQQDGEEDSLDWAALEQIMGAEEVTGAGDDVENLAMLLDEDDRSSSARGGSGYGSGQSGDPRRHLQSARSRMLHGEGYTGGLGATFNRNGAGRAGASAAVGTMNDDEGEEQPNPVCDCGTESIRLTARSEQNSGRVFFKCDNKSGDGSGSGCGCNFFQWADELGPSCKCGRPSVRLTCKTGNNAGRVMFRCVRRDDLSCDFFQWEDERQPGVGFQMHGTSSSSAGGAGGTGASGGGAGGGQGDTVMCTCGQPAPLKTVSKEGPNKGRQFYCCCRPYGSADNCSFFMWADDDDETANGTSTSSGFGGGGGGGPRGFSSDGGSFSTTRGGNGGGGGGGGDNACFNCGQPGHFASRCPNRGPSSSSSSSLRRRRKTGGAGGGGSSPSRSRSRKCGICRQPGHTRRNCPDA